MNDKTSHTTFLMKRILVTILLLLFCNVQAIQAANTGVLSPSSQGTAFEYVIEKGYMQGDPDGNFHPERPISRAELSTVLARTLYDQEMIGAWKNTDYFLAYPNGRFTDLPLNSWYAPYIVTLYNYGKVQGYDDLTFRPQAILTLAETAQMLAHAYVLDEVPGELVGEVWYTRAIASLKAFDALPAGRSPFETVTRGEVAQMIYAILRYFETPDNLVTFKYGSFFFNHGVITAPPCYDFRPVPVSLATLKIIGGCYIADDTHVYSGSFQIPNADPGSFEVLYVGKNDAQIGKDKNSLYLDMFPVEGGVDTQTFELLGGHRYGADKNHIYFIHVVVDDEQNRRVLASIVPADRETFQVNGGSDFLAYAFDKVHVFVEGAILAEADPATFVFLSSEWHYENYAKDARSIFVGDRQLVGADYDSFIYLRHGYAKDKYHVYSGGGKVEVMADPATFEILDDGYARDKNNMYTHFDVLEVVK